MNDLYPATNTSAPNSAVGDHSLAQDAVAYVPSARISVTEGRSLMPYEAAAKAIFVKANGLLAYARVTGLVEGPVNDRRNAEDGRRAHLRARPAVE